MAATAGGVGGVVTSSKQISESCFDFLAMEMVDYVVRTTTITNTPDGNTNTTTTTPNGASNNSNNSNSEGIFYKLERLGFRVGQRLAERYTMDHQRFQDTLEVIKFICKEFWTTLYKKQIDNLKTNHRGVYVLIDSRFRPLLHVSTDVGGTASGQGGSGGNAAQQALGGKDVASLYVTFPCGIIRGALQALAVPAVVTVDVSAMPQATFTIKVKS